MVKCRGAIPFITVAKSKRYCKGVKSIASELTFTTKSNTFYSLSIPFTFSTVIKGIAFSIFNQINVTFIRRFTFALLKIEFRVSSNI